MYESRRQWSVLVQCAHSTYSRADDGAVPWGDRVWPYCISVRDCYEKALGALCGKHNPRQPLSECFAALTKADFCTDAAKPYPCPNGCQASFEDCARRGKKEEAFVQRNL